MTKHAVGGDEAVANILPQNIHLHLGKGDGAVGDELLLQQGQVRIAQRNHRAFQENLLPIGKALAPEPAADGIVQRLHGAKALFQPCPEGLVVSLGIEYVGFTVQLIVDLPANDGRMIAVTLRQLGNNPAHISMIYRGIVVIVPAMAVTVQGAVLPGVQHFGMGMGQPGRRRGGGSSHNDLHLFLCGQRKELVKQREIPRIVLRLNHAPGELKHPHGFDAVGLHAA